MATEPDCESIAERVVVALVSALLAGLTLVLLPIAFVLTTRGMGGGMEFDIGAIAYAVVFSKAGIAIVVVAAVTGFLVGSERMANIFSFFWGTHGLWSRCGAYIDDKLWQLTNDEHNKVLKALIILAVALLVGAMIRWAR